MGVIRLQKVHDPKPHQGVLDAAPGNTILPLELGPAGANMERELHFIKNQLRLFVPMLSAMADGTTSTEEIVDLFQATTGLELRAVDRAKELVAAYSAAMRNGKLEPWEFPGLIYRLTRLGRALVGADAGAVSGDPELEAQIAEDLAAARAEDEKPAPAPRKEFDGREASAKPFRDRTEQEKIDMEAAEKVPAPMSEAKQKELVNDPALRAIIPTPSEAKAKEASARAEKAGAEEPKAKDAGAAAKVKDAKPKG